MVARGRGANEDTFCRGPPPSIWEFKKTPIYFFALFPLHTLVGAIRGGEKKLSGPCAYTCLPMKWHLWSPLSSSATPRSTPGVEWGGGGGEEKLYQSLASLLLCPTPPPHVLASFPPPPFFIPLQCLWASVHPMPPRTKVDARSRCTNITEPRRRPKSNPKSQLFFTHQKRVVAHHQQVQIHNLFGYGKICYYPICRYKQNLCERGGGFWEGEGEREREGMPPKKCTSLKYTWGGRGGGSRHLHKKQQKRYLGGGEILFFTKVSFSNSPKETLA